MQYNKCKTCFACDGRAGLLINNECLNCYETRSTGVITLHTCLNRTPGEISRTLGILDTIEEPGRTLS